MHLYKGLKKGVGYAAALAGTAGLALLFSACGNAEDSTPSTPNPPSLSSYQGRLDFGFAVPTPEGFWTTYDLRKGEINCLDFEATYGNNASRVFESKTIKELSGKDVISLSFTINPDYPWMKRYTGSMLAPTTAAEVIEVERIIQELCEVDSNGTIL
jgi:hypothetical protein